MWSLHWLLLGNYICPIKHSTFSISQGKKREPLPHTPWIIFNSEFEEYNLLETFRSQAYNVTIWGLRCSRFNHITKCILNCVNWDVIKHTRGKQFKVCRSQFTLKFSALLGSVSKAIIDKQLVKWILTNLPWFINLLKYDMTVSDSIKNCS